MIVIKSKREIEIMKEAGRITAYAHRKVQEAIQPGISTAELDKIAEDAIRECGAIPSFKNYEGYPASICASVNEVVIHGIPSKNIILKNGDIKRIIDLIKQKALIKYGIKLHVEQRLINWVGVNTDEKEEDKN